MQKRKARSSSHGNVIAVFGAREHNLKNIDVEIPRGKFVVITGVSGSGKSSLAFDILFSEGQRRFLDSMNAYARQFVEQMARPDVDLIEGLPPAVSIEQRTSMGGGKSTVATVTEVYQFIRLLFARLGTQYCPECQVSVEEQTRDELLDSVFKTTSARTGFRLLAPLIKNRKGYHSEVAVWAQKHGYKEVRADGRLFDSSKPLKLDRYKEHDVQVVTSHFGSRPTRRVLQESIDLTLQIGKGNLYLLEDSGESTMFSTDRSCPGCGVSYEKLEPKLFSYNSPYGWCPECRGFGETFYLPDVDRGASADAIEESWFGWQEGDRETCPICLGSRLNTQARSVRLEAGNQVVTVEDLAKMNIREAFSWFDSVKFDRHHEIIARDIIPEIRERLSFLMTVGLDYLQMGRAAPTLSGGEAQRIRLAAQLGSNLSGVMYVLDEPTIGLHAHDNQQLLKALRQLVQRGNSLVVVEHDEDTMRQSDYILDLGPGAGIHGGELVAAGTFQEIKKSGDSLTGQYLRKKRTFPSNKTRRPVPLKKGGSSQIHDDHPCLHLLNVNKNNLMGVEVKFPLGRFTCVTGLSGSGKSTLVRECLLPQLKAALGPSTSKDESTLLKGAKYVKSVYEVDQSPIGRTPRSTPATYVGFFDSIRALFSRTPEARLRGFSPGRFSFNSPQGRCPECKGAGVIKLEMNFLPPAFMTCEACEGLRFTTETLEIQYKGKTIFDVLSMSVEEALVFFSASREIRQPLQALCDTGLEYLKLGQTSPTLSGGEAQRVKLVTHLLSGIKYNENKKFEGNRTSDKGVVFILEEPTIGLHMADVHRLTGVLHRLVDAGHTVIVIEHNLEMIAESDWIIDLGPGGGDQGGRIIAEGTPEVVAGIKGSLTGHHLKPLLSK